MNDIIIDTERGPSLGGTRITVHDVLAETQAGMTPGELADFYHLPLGYIEAALRYIDEHRAEVTSELAAARERAARGNPPHIQAKVDAARARFQEYVTRFRRAKAEANGDARHPE